MSSEIAKRLRAARSYSGLSQPQFAKLMNCGRVHITDLEMGRDEPTSNELVLWALHTQLPETFFTADWSRLNDTADPDALERIEAKLDSLTAAQPAAESPAAVRTSGSKAAGTGTSRKVKVPARSGLKGSPAPVPQDRKQRSD